MNFTISSQVLHKHLAALHGVIISNPIIPILDNFLFEIANKKLKIKASDLQTTIITELPLEVEGSITIAIPARILLDTLKNLPEQPIKFHINESNYSISITSSTGKYILAGENPNDFPNIAENSSEEITELPSSILKRAIQQTIIATTTNDLKPFTNGIWMSFEENGLTFVGTDLNRLVRYQHKNVKNHEHTPFILPRKSLTLLSNLAPTNDEPIKISYNKENIHFQWEDLILIARPIDERYPAYEEIISKNNPHQFNINRLDLLSSLKRIVIYANKLTYQVTLSFQPSQVTILAEDTGFDNKAQEELMCEYTGDPGFQIGFNSKHLIELLQSLSTEKINFHFSNSRQPSIIVPTPQQKDEDILILLMPLSERKR